MTIDWLSFGVGLVLGFILGFLAVSVFKHKAVTGDQFLAWVIACSWVTWHVGAGVGLVAAPPPTMYDVVSGGAVGFILGEKFWEGIKFWRK